MSHTHSAPSAPDVASQSSPPTARNLPFGWNATASSVLLSPASGMTRIASATPNFHTQMSPSETLAVARSCPSDEKVGEPIGPRVCVRTASTFFDATSHTFTSSVGPLVAIRLQSGLAATKWTSSLLSAGHTRWPLSRSQAWSSVPAVLNSVKPQTAIECRALGFGPATSLPVVTSQMWTTRSEPALASRVPDGLKARARISSVWPLSTYFCLACLGSSHTWIVKSESAQARSPPSGLKATALTWSEWALRSMDGSSLPGSHTRAVVSQPTEIRNSPFGCQAIAGTRSVWPRHSRTSDLSRTSQTRIRWSSPALVSCLPSALKARAETLWSCPSNSATRCRSGIRQNWIRPSSCPLARSWPSGEKANAVTQQPALTRASSRASAVSQTATSLVPDASRLAS